MGIAVSMFRHWTHLGDRVPSRDQQSPIESAIDLSMSAPAQIGLQKNQAIVSKARETKP
jgi:hypothetical protein